MLAIKNNKFYTILFPIIVGIALSGQIFLQNYLVQGFTLGTTTMIRTITFLLYAMSMISFVQSIRIKNSIPQGLLPPRHKIQLRNNHPLYQQRNTCIKENNIYKPLRTSHCSICGCVTRMDHHCPYINNCVGASNLKAFILFTAYGGLFALSFLFLSIRFYFLALEKKENPLQQLTSTIWMILTVISFLFSLSMNGIAISMLVTAAGNVTRMDMLKGNFSLSDIDGSRPNPFNLGILTNFASIFGDNSWLFWWPSQLVLFADATDFPMVPTINEEDISKLYQNVQDMIQNTFQKSIPKTIQQLRVQEVPKYENVIFFYLGIQYKIESGEEKQEQQEQQKGISSVNVTGEEHEEALRGIYNDEE